MNKQYKHRFYVFFFYDLGDPYTPNGNGKG